MPKRLLLRYEWWILGTVAMTGIALSFWGLWDIASSSEKGHLPGTLASALYQSLQGFWFNSSPGGTEPLPWPLHVGRLLTLVAAASVGGGLILELLRNEIRRSRARHMKGHVIICGLGTLGTAAADSVLNGNRQLTIVESAPSSATESFARRGAGIVIGDATDPFTLMEAGADRARYLIACCGNDDRNASVAEAARSVVAGIPRRKGFLSRRSPAPLCVRIHISDPDLLRQLRPCILELSAPGIDVDFFSVAEIAASRIVRMTFSEMLAEKTTDLDAVVIGRSVLAEQLILHLARAAARSQRCADCPVVGLACVDASVFINRIAARHSKLLKNIDLHPIALPTSNDETTVEEALVPGGSPRFRIAFVCNDDDGSTVTTTLALTAAARVRPKGFRVISCIYGQSGIASLIEHSSGRRLTVFDAADAVRDPMLITLDTIEVLAKMRHANYFVAESTKPEFGRSPNCVEWDKLDPEHKEDNRSQVRSFVERLAEAGLHLVPLTDQAEDMPTIDPAMVECLAIKEHQRWVGFKEARGWKLCKPGERNPEQKLHDCLVDWFALPDDEKEKDRQTIRQMATLLEEVGMAVVRTGSLEPK